VGLLTPRQAAAELAISTRQLRDLSLDGDITFINVGRGDRPARRYEMSDLEVFKAERRTVSYRTSGAPASRRIANSPATKPIDIQEVFAARQQAKLAAKKLKATKSLP
jgi:hypothetical protein